MEYVGNYVSSLLSIIFIVFIIIVLGYLLGYIKIKGISLGSAGVLIVALIFGIVVYFFPSINIGGKEIVLYGPTIKSECEHVASAGTAMFVTAVGLMAGPTFFRNMNRSFIYYILIGLLTVIIGAIVTILIIVFDKSISSSLATGLMAGALTSTPALSSAREVASNQELVTAGYGISYIFGVLGVVYFVQIMPRLAHVNMKEERKHLKEISVAKAKNNKGKYKEIDTQSIFAFALAVVFGCLLGSIKIPGLFSLGNSCGCLISGLIIGHFGHIGKIDLYIHKKTLGFFRELGLVFFLIGAGVPAGVNFINHVKLSYFIYGVLITIIPMIISYFVSKKIFKLDILNSLGCITGGMTSTPALGALIDAAGTDEVANAYAITYPISLVLVVVIAKVIVMLF